MALPRGAAVTCHCHAALTVADNAVTLTFIELMFDIVKMGPGISQARRLSVGGNRNGVSPDDGLPPGYGARPGGAAFPVLPALGELLPGGLARGSVVAAGRWSLLCLALAAGASVAGAWCAVAGVPQLGVSAAVGVGLDPGPAAARPGSGHGLAAGGRLAAGWL